MSDPHVHCGQCFREMPFNGGVFETGEQLVFAHGSSGPEVHPRRVPLCTECFARVKARSLGIEIPTISAVKDNTKGTR
jgi:hypothetical protein